MTAELPADAQTRDPKHPGHPRARPAGQVEPAASDINFTLAQHLAELPG